MKVKGKNRNGGWILIHRQISENWLWQKKPFSPGQAWIDIILNVNHKKVSVNILGKVIDCHRGQSLMSLNTWANNWGWSVSKVRRFFNILEKEGMISRLKIGQATQLTVINYDTYQKSRNSTDTVTDTVTDTANLINNSELQDKPTQKPTQKPTLNKEYINNTLLEENLQDNENDEKSNPDSRVKELINYFSARHEKIFPGNVYEKRNFPILGKLFKEKLKNHDVDIIKKKIDLFIVPEQTTYGFHAELFIKRFGNLIVKKQREY